MTRVGSTPIKMHNLLQVVNRHEQCSASNCEQCCAAPNIVNKIAQSRKQCCDSIIQPSILLQLANKVEQQ